MSNIWGKNIRLSIFGESHGKAVGIVIDGLPPGIELDLEYIQKEMRRRAPGTNELSTTRREGDRFEILSGCFKGRTTGTPLSAVIYNSAHRSGDYEAVKSVMRPGHADYTGYVKYSGFNDYRGGGHFSGRITASLVFAGAIARQMLAEKDIVIGSHIKSIADIEEASFNVADVGPELLKGLVEKEFPVMDDGKGQEMKDCILKVKADKDSAGGVIETAAVNLPAGIGSPFFDSVESKLSHLLFSIPAVKGVEFGAGFAITKMKGSEANDEMYIEEGEVRTYSNNNGGIIGGITNGMPVIFRTAIKPTPSIGISQRSVNIEEGRGTVLKIEGRHDPCIVPRAVPVIEAVTAIGLFDLMIEGDGFHGRA